MRTALILLIALSWTIPCWAGVGLVNTTHGTSNAETAVVTMPTGTQLNNDIQVWLMTSNNASSVCTSSAQAFVQVGVSTNTNDGYYLMLCRRISGGNEGASQTFDSGAGNVILNWMARTYSGESTSTPEDSGGNSTNVGNLTATASVTGITIANAAGGQAVFCAGTATSSTTFSTPSGFSNAVTENNGSVGDTLFCADKAVPSGATGTISSTIGASSNWAAFLMAIKPSASAASSWFMP